MRYLRLSTCTIRRKKAILSTVSMTNYSFPISIRSCESGVRENFTTRAVTCGKADGKTVSGLAIGKTIGQHVEQVFC